jgi:hypothetical protein
MFSYPHIFYLKVIGIVQDNLPMYVFRKIFPLKVARASRIWGPKSQRCPFKSGVIDTAVHDTAVSMTPLCCVQPSQISWYKKTVCRNIFEDTGIRKKVVCTAVSLTLLWQVQRCHWHRCAIIFVDYLREFKAIFEKALTSVSGTQGKLFDEKKQRSKISCPGPF